MTQLKPTLQLRRLIVTKGGAHAYDERFHAGVNIIRGENSTGKSTIADLIFFALGGDLRDWKDEAVACDSTFAEVVINGAPVTLKRDIGKAPMRPMAVHLGPLDDGASKLDWYLLPFARRGDKESYSQMIFRLLGLPDVPGEVGENLTMHQILRLMYVDQMTQPFRIFRVEPQWDSPEKRQAIGDFLLGVLDHRVYEHKLTLRDRERDYELVSRQLTSVFDVIDEVEQRLHSDDIKLKREELIENRRTLYATLENLKRKRGENAKESGAGQKLINELRDNLSSANEAISELQLKAAQTDFAIKDATALISEIERKLRMLSQGEQTRDALGPLELTFCPVCFHPLDEEATAQQCALCHHPLDAEAEAVRRQRLQNELQVQLKESRSLQDRRFKEFAQYHDDLALRLRERESIRDRFLSLSRNYLSDHDTLIQETIRQIGFLERELGDLDRREKQAEQIELLKKAKSDLAEQIARLKEEIADYESQAVRRRREAYPLVSQKVAEVLSHDLTSEAEFSLKSEVSFNFGEDRIVVNQKVGYSASSLTVIRNAFHLGLLWASTIDAKFEYPRFLLMDNIEDKGMNQARSRNFQRAIVELSASISTEHQIIFTTSMVDPILVRPELTVGDHYTFDNKSLKMKPTKSTLL